VSADPKTPEPDLSGQTLDRYHLLRRLGVGGMGAVYEAEHTRLRKRFAVKLLRWELAQNEVFRKRFLREARAASAITHPNVVAISDFGETHDDHVFFVMDLLAGRDLQALLDAEQRLPWPRVREILLQTTSALEAAHLQDIIHRDIKPSNVFLADVPGKRGEDFVKVLDFGIAKLSGNLGEGTAQLTSTDEIFGTVAYMAPEMAMGTNDDRRSDVYAVGVMMYRMLTGGLPFTQGNAFQVLSQHIHAPLPRPRAKEPSIPVEVEAIVLKALAKRPEDRFASMDAFGRALRRGSLEAHGAAVMQHQTTVVSSPIVVGMSEPTGAPIAEVTTGLSRPISIAPSGSVVAAKRKRPAAWLVVPVLAVVGLSVGSTMFVLGSQVDGADEGTEEANGPESPPLDTRATQEMEPLLPVVDSKQPDESSTPLSNAEPISTPPVETEPPVDTKSPEPTDVTQPAKPKPSKRSTPQKPVKPKTDREIVTALQSKLLAKCKLTGTVKVKIEGMITSTGTVQGLLITPPDGPGVCVDRLVSPAKFDPAGGTRPMPRFSVSL